MKLIFNLAVTLIMILFFVSCSSSGSGEKLNIVDFIDNTQNYKGLTITMGLNIGSHIFKNRGDSLRNYIGKNVKFCTFGPNNARLDISIKIPNGMQVPNAVYLDTLIVKFNCNDGSLLHGNEAISIERP